MWRARVLACGLVMMMMMGTASEAGPLKRGNPYYVPSYFQYVPPYPGYYGPVPTYYSALAALEKQAEAAGQVAYLHVLVPDPEAIVWIDKHQTTSRGEARLMETPPLETGKTHRYQLRATWKQAGQEVSRERQVEVMPGQTTVVDFRER